MGFRVCCWLLFSFISEEGYLCLTDYQQRPKAVPMTSSKTVPSPSMRSMVTLKKWPGKKNTRPASCPNLVAHALELRSNWTIQAIGSQ